MLALQLLHTIAAAMSLTFLSFHVYCSHVLTPEEGQLQTDRALSPCIVRSARGLQVSYGWCQCVGHTHP